MKYVDLSHVLDSSTPAYPGDLVPELSQYKTIEKDSYNAFYLKTGLHTGTHIDMPIHLVEDSRFARDFEIGHFAGRGVMIDARGQNPIEMRPEYRELDLEGAALILRTGFDKNFGLPEYYESYPEVSDELTAFLSSSGIKILGLDTPSPDYFPFRVHKELLPRGIFVLENLTNLQALEGVERFDILALPLKLSAEASPVRAAAAIY